MKNLTKDKLTRKSGFSLLEIVVVIGMISVLLLVLVPNVSAYREKTEDTKIKSEMLNVYLGAETIIESYDTKQELDEYFLLNPQGELVETKEGKRVNDKLTKYTNISDFTNYSFKVALDSNDYPILEYIEYTGPLKSYRFDGDADSFMFDGKTYKDDEIGGRNLISNDSSIWEVGSVNGTASSGVDFPQDETLRSPYTPIPKGDYVLNVHSHLAVTTWIHVYDENKRGLYVFPWSESQSRQITIRGDNQTIRVLLRPLPRLKVNTSMVGTDLKIKLEKALK